MPKHARPTRPPRTGRGQTPTSLKDALEKANRAAVLVDVDVVGRSGSVPAVVAPEVPVAPDVVVPESVVAFRNGDVVVIANAGDSPVELPEGDVLLASEAIDGRTLPADTTVWLAA